jgi:hypothetical protein
MPHHTSLLRQTLLALLLLSLASTAAAQWKWRDASGKIQYSDLPPPAGTADKDILQRPPGQRQPITVRSADEIASAPKPAASAPKPPSRAELEQQARQKQQDAEAAKKEQDEARRNAEMKAENCRRATEQLRLLQDGVRLTRRNAVGENIPLDDQQRAEEIRQTRAVMASECKP